MHASSEMMMTSLLIEWLDAVVVQNGINKCKLNVNVKRQGVPFPKNDYGNTDTRLYRNDGGWRANHSSEQNSHVRSGAEIVIGARNLLRAECGAKPGCLD